MKRTFLLMFSLVCLTGPSFASSVEQRHGGHETHAGHSMAAGHTVPSDGAVLDRSPPHFMIQFSHAMTLEHLLLVTLTGETIKLDISEVERSDHIMVRLPPLQADDYKAVWRATGDDAHVMSGSVSFIVE